MTLTLIPPPVLTLSTTSASFSGTTGAANPTGQSVTITNTGGGTLNWTASKTQSWLTLSAGSGTAPSSLGLSISNAGLSSGTYTDTVTISASGATGSPQTVTVTLTLIPPPVLTLSTTSASFTGTTGAANPTGQSISITNPGGQTLNWTATQNTILALSVGWLGRRAIEPRSLDLKRGALIGHLQPTPSQSVRPAPPDRPRQSPLP